MAETGIVNWRTIGEEELERYILRVGRKFLVSLECRKRSLLSREKEKITIKT